MTDHTTTTETPPAITAEDFAAFRAGRIRMRGFRECLLTHSQHERPDPDLDDPAAFWVLNGPDGQEHRLCCAGTTLERLNAHWAGFCTTV